jgi:DNA polymerase elongation subunit (family B)
MIEVNEFDEVLIVNEERDLITSFISLVFKFDPDIIYGYDIEKTSLYYLAIRAMFVDIDVLNFISRAPRNIEEIFVNRGYYHEILAISNL